MGLAKLGANIQRVFTLTNHKLKIFCFVFITFALWKILEYMFNKNIKLIIALALIAFGIYQITDRSVGNGIMYILLSTIFIFLYFKNEMILLAFLKLRKQDFPGAKKWLDRIKNPNSALVKKQQGYFYYLHGLMESQNNMNQAEKFFKQAVSLGLSMDHDMAMAKLNLAGIAFSKRRAQEAKKLMSEAQKLDKRGLLADQIKMMKDQMKKASIPQQHYGNRNMKRR